MAPNIKKMDLCANTPEAKALLEGLTLMGNNHADYCKDGGTVVAKPHSDNPDLMDITAHSPHQGDLFTFDIYKTKVLAYKTKHPQGLVQPKQDQHYQNLQGQLALLEKRIQGETRAAYAFGGLTGAGLLTVLIGAATLVASPVPATIRNEEGNPIGTIGDPGIKPISVGLLAAGGILAVGNLIPSLTFSGIVGKHRAELGQLKLQLTPLPQGGSVALLSGRF